MNYTCFNNIKYNYLSNSNHMTQYSSPTLHANEMQRMYANLLKREYKEILNLHMTELMVLNYAHHVRNNDT